MSHKGNKLEKTNCHCTFKVNVITSCSCVKVNTQKGAKDYTAFYQFKQNELNSRQTKVNSSNRGVDWENMLNTFLGNNFCSIAEKKQHSQTASHQSDPFSFPWSSIYFYIFNRIEVLLNSEFDMLEQIWIMQNVKWTFSSLSYFVCICMLSFRYIYCYLIIVLRLNKKNQYDLPLYLVVPLNMTSNAENER